MLVPAEFGSIVCYRVWVRWLQRSLVPVLVSTEFGSIGSYRVWFHGFLWLLAS